MAAYVLPEHQQQQHVEYTQDENFEPAPQQQQQEIEMIAEYVRQWVQYLLSNQSVVDPSHLTNITNVNRLLQATLALKGQMEGRPDIFDSRDLSSMSKRIADLEKQLDVLQSAQSTERMRAEAEILHKLITIRDQRTEFMTRFMGQHEELGPDLATPLIPLQMEWEEEYRKKIVVFFNAYKNSNFVQTLAATTSFPSQ